MGFLASLLRFFHGVLISEHTGLSRQVGGSITYNCCVSASPGTTATRISRIEEESDMADMPKYPGKVEVINGNGAVARIMNMVCGGVIGYPITPSTEISETFEAAIAAGQRNVWGHHPFFFEPEGEHSAQSGAMGAALTGGKFISNASSSQGILYGMESHFVTVGKRIGGFVLQVAARVVSRHSLNVMGGHDDVYALLPAGYTVLFGANPEEAANLALISYRASSLSLIPVANCMDGFATSHMMSEARLPEPELVKEYLGDPEGYISCPTAAQEILFGAKGRAYQFGQFLEVNSSVLPAASVTAIRSFLDAPDNAKAIEKDSAGELFDTHIAGYLPEGELPRWRRQWVNAPERGTRKLIPSLVDIDNPGLTGPVQNQPDYQAGVADHRTHFVADVPRLVRQAMDEYNALTGSDYAPIKTFMCEDADYIMVGLGSICEDVQAVLPYLRSQGLKVGLVQVVMLQPFPEAELIEALKGAKAVTVLERSDQAALSKFVDGALVKASQNAVAATNGRPERFPGIPALGVGEMPELSTGFFGIGGHDVQPRHLIATYKSMQAGDLAPEFYIGSTFFDDNAVGEEKAMQDLLRKAYPETTKMALHLEENPKDLLPDEAMRIRFHSVGGYGTIATGKLLTDILAEMLHLHSKAAPKYGSEKSGAATNYYITLSPEPIKITNAELEDVEIVVSPDHMVFAHTNPLKGLAEGGTFILQSSESPADFWASLPKRAKTIIREKRINLFILDAFGVAKKHAPDPGLQTRMMGVAFIGAIATKVDRIASGASEEDMLAKIREQIDHKFGAKGQAIVDANMAVVKEGAAATQKVDWEQFDASGEVEGSQAVRKPLPVLNSSLSAMMCHRGSNGSTAANGLFDRDYFNTVLAEPFAEGTISESPVYPGIGSFIPAGSSSEKDKGLFRRTIPVFESSLCTGCMECALACPDGAIPNLVFNIDTLIETAIDEAGEAAAALKSQVEEIATALRAALLATKQRPAVAEVFKEAVAGLTEDTAAVEAVAKVLQKYPVARTRPFFDSTEKRKPGKGVFFTATVDPWKCTGCLECVAVCGPNALIATDQDADVLEMAKERFAFMTKLPNSPKEFSDPNGGPSLDLKRIFLDRDNYYATIGGHGACRGCGEVTAVRQTMSLANEINHARVAKHREELDELVTALQEKRKTVTDSQLSETIDRALKRLERRLYRYEGPAGSRGPAAAVVANSTGCSSVYASTAPYNPYQQPWVNGLFQDAQPLAKGIFEGLAADLSSDVLAMRQARAILNGASGDAIPVDPPEWHGFTEDELALMPPVLTIGGDGASYDIGFGAMSRILASGTPIKMLVLNTGAYSNTGGQASTASLEGQDSDLSRYGRYLKGKAEQRKELGLLAAMHPNVLVVCTSTAYQGHFLKNVSRALEQVDYPAVIDVYTSCQPEHGIGDDMSSEHSRLAVKSRVSPLFVHEPERAEFSDRFIIDGNPDARKLWSNYKLSYTDPEGATKLMDLPYTPADFAFGEMRFRKHFWPLPDTASNPTLVADYIEMDPEDREEATPFIYSTGKDGKLVKIQISPSMVLLTEQCKEYWTFLQYLAGQDLAALRKANGELEKQLEQKAAELEKSQEETIDLLAKAMAEVAATGTTATPLPFLGGFGGGNSSGGAASGAADVASGGAGAGEGSGVPFRYDPDSIAKCTDCKNCYQELPEYFEASTEIIDGKPTPVARLIPGSLESVVQTDELRARIAKVIANCDAEIIQ